MPFLPRRRPEPGVVVVWDVAVAAPVVTVPVAVPPVPDAEVPVPVKPDDVV